MLYFQFEYLNRKKSYFQEFPFTSPGLVVMWHFVRCLGCVFILLCSPLLWKLLKGMLSSAYAIKGPASLGDTRVYAGVKGLVKPRITSDNLLSNSKIQPQATPDLCHGHWVTATDISSVPNQIGRRAWKAKTNTVPRTMLDSPWLFTAQEQSCW